MPAMSRPVAFVLTLVAIVLGALIFSARVEGQRSAPPADAVGQAQAPAAGPPAPAPTPESFRPASALPSSSAFEDQPEKGQANGFDFFRDPLNAKKPMMTFEEIMQADVADKPKVMETQRRLLERRYNLSPRLDGSAKMSRGKALPVGPTAKLASGVNWDALGRMSPDEIKRRGIFPYPALPHPKQVTGGQVFQQEQIRMFPRLERFDVISTCRTPSSPSFRPRSS
jgi:hypothetical protein